MAYSLKVDRQGGAQERAYGPHVTTAILTYTADRANELPRTEEQVKAHARAHVGNFREGPGDGSMDSHYMTKLASFERTDNGSDELMASYTLRLETPFTD